MVLEAMGNSLRCSASGERLVSAVRDGDAVEARMLLELSPALARYSTFGGLNSPLHFATANGHLDIVTLLLEKGAHVNARNYCGQALCLVEDTRATEDEVLIIRFNRMLLTRLKDF